MANLKTRNPIVFLALLGLVGAACDSVTPGRPIVYRTKPNKPKPTSTPTATPSSSPSSSPSSGFVYAPQNQTLVSAQGLPGGDLVVAAALPPSVKPKRPAASRLAVLDSDGSVKATADIASPILGPVRAADFDTILAAHEKTLEFLDSSKLTASRPFTASDTIVAVDFKGGVVAAWDDHGRIYLLGKDGTQFGTAFRKKPADHTWIRQNPFEVSPAGQVFVADADNNVVQSFSRTSTRPQPTLAFGTDKLVGSTLRLINAGKELALASSSASDSTLHVFDLSHAAADGSWPDSPIALKGAQFAQSSFLDELPENQVLVAGASVGAKFELMFINLKNSSIEATVELDGAPTAESVLATSASDRFFVATAATAYFFAADGTRLRDLKIPSSGLPLVLDDGQTVVSGVDGLVHFLNPKDLSDSGSFDAASTLTRVEDVVLQPRVPIAQHGQFVAVATEEGKVHFLGRADAGETGYYKPSQGGTMHQPPVVLGDGTMVIRVEGGNRPGLHFFLDGKPVPKK